MILPYMLVPSRGFVCGIFFLVALFLTGCEKSIGRQPVSGSVTHNGRPVVYGTISFAPDVSKGVTGPQGYAEIRNGRYQTDADKGPVSGAHVVRITGWMSSPEEGILGAAVFSEYTTQVEIPAAGSQLDFDVPSQPSGTRK